MHKSLICLTLPLICGHAVTGVNVSGSIWGSSFSQKDKAKDLSRESFIPSTSSLVEFDDFDNDASIDELQTREDESLESTTRVTTDGPTVASNDPEVSQSIISEEHTSDGPRDNPLTDYDAGKFISVLPSPTKMADAQGTLIELLFEFYTARKSFHKEDNPMDSFTASLLLSWVASPPYRDMRIKYLFDIVFRRIYIIPPQSRLPFSIFDSLLGSSGADAEPTELEYDDNTPRDENRLRGDDDVRNAEAFTTVPAAASAQESAEKLSEGTKVLQGASGRTSCKFGILYLLHISWQPWHQPLLCEKCVEGNASHFVIGLHLLIDEFQWHERGNAVQRAFTLLLDLPMRREEQGHEALDDKSVQYVLDQLDNWSVSGITAWHIPDLAQCDVDIVNGRTFVMKFIELGFVRALTHSFTVSHLFPPQLLGLRDGSDNNVFHLAAMSGDVATLEAVIKLVSTRGNLSATEVTEFLDSRNAQGQRPMDLVMRQPALLQKFKSFYATLAKLGKARQRTVQWHSS